MASTHADLANLLHEVDGHLGLAVHRGEHDQRWKAEATVLITRIREAIGDISRGALTSGAGDG